MTDEDRELIRKLISAVERLVSEIQRDREPKQYIDEQGYMVTRGRGGGAATPTYNRSEPGDEGGTGTPR